MKKIMYCVTQMMSTKQKWKKKHNFQFYKNIIVHQFIEQYRMSSGKPIHHFYPSHMQKCIHITQIRFDVPHEFNKESLLYTFPGGRLI